MLPLSNERFSGGIAVTSFLMVRMIISDCSVIRFYRDEFFMKGKWDELYPVMEWVFHRSDKKNRAVISDTFSFKQDDGFFSRRNSFVGLSLLKSKVYSLELSYYFSYLHKIMVMGSYLKRKKVLLELNPKSKTMLILIIV